MDADMVANVAWSLLGAVMVGATITYACMHQLISRAYDEGRKDSLSAIPTAVRAICETPSSETPTCSPEPSATPAA